MRGLPGPAPVTSGPGSGYVVSVLSGVLHPLLRLATKRSGRLKNGIVGAGPVPAAIVTAPQFL